MPGIVGVLDHLGGFDIGTNQRRAQFRVEVDQHFAAGFTQFANHRLGRIVKVQNGGSLAQEFGIVANTEVGAGTLARTGFQRRDDDLAHGSRQHGAAHDDDGCAVHLAYRLADLLADAPHIFQVDAAIGQTGCADTDHQEIGLGNGGRLCRGTQPARRHLGGNDVSYPFFDDRCLAGVDQVDLGLFRVYAGDDMSALGKTGR